MKKKVIIGIIIFLVIFIMASYYFYSSNHQSFDYSDIINDYNVELPINSPREAIEYAKDNNIINQSSLNEVKEDTQYLSGWEIFSDKVDSNWQIKIVSIGVIPTYSCIYSFDKDGDAITENFVLKECGWNK